jgi:hypothetical protein
METNVKNILYDIREISYDFEKGNKYFIIKKFTNYYKCKNIVNKGCKKHDNILFFYK